MAAFANRAIWYHAGMRKATFGLAVLVLVTAFVATGIVHDVVHHEHGHTPEDAALWQQLHSGIRHDEKKQMPVPDASVMLMLSLLAIVAMTRIARPDVPPASDPIRGEYLRRGIAAHRRFA
jgi:hypothetical protein